MPLGSLKRENDRNITDQGNVLDFSAKENLNASEKPIFDAVGDAMDKVVEATFSNPQEMKDLAKEIVKTGDEDTFFDGPVMLSKISDKVLEVSGSKDMFRRQLASLGNQIATDDGLKGVLMQKIKEGQDWELTIIGMQKVAATLQTLANEADAANDAALAKVYRDKAAELTRLFGIGTQQTNPNGQPNDRLRRTQLYDGDGVALSDVYAKPDIITSQGGLTRISRKDMEKARRKAGKEKNYDKKALLREDSRQLIVNKYKEENGEQLTDLVHMYDQYVEPYEIEVWDKTGKINKHAKKVKNRLHPKNKPAVRRALESLFDQEKAGAPELMKKHFPVKLFTKPGGFFDVMNAIKEARTTSSNDPMYDKLRTHYQQGFKNLKVKDLKEMGFTNRPLKMVKILQRANWDDLLVLSAVLHNSTSTEEGILTLWAAYERTGASKSDTKEIFHGGESLDSLIDNDIKQRDIFSFLCDFNLDGHLIANLQPEQLRQLYPDLAGRKLYKAQKKALRYKGDVGPQFGQTVQFTIDSVIAQLDIVHGAGKGEEIVVKNIIKEIYGQMMISGFLTDKLDFGPVKNDQLSHKLEDIINGQKPANKNVLTALVQEHPYFHSMFKAAIFTMAGGSETTKEAPSPVNLDNVLRGDTIKTLEEGRKESMKQLREDVNIWLENNPDFEDLIKREGKIKVRNNLCGLFMKAANKMVLRFNSGDFTSLLQRDIIRDGLLKVIGQSLGKILTNKHGDGTVGLTFPVGFPPNYNTKRTSTSPDGTKKREQQFFAGVEWNFTKPTTWKVGVGYRIEHEAMMKKDVAFKNINLQELVSADYRTIEGEIRSYAGFEGSAFDITNTEAAEVSAGLGVAKRYIDQIHRAGDAYESVMKNDICSQIKEDSLTTMITGSSTNELINKIEKSMETGLLHSGSALVNKNNMQQFGQNIDTITAMLKKELLFEPGKSAFDSIGSPEKKAAVLMDLILNINSGIVEQWKDGQFSRLHGALKLTKISFGAKVKVLQLVMAIATMGGSLVAAAIKKAAKAGSEVVTAGELNVAEKIATALPLELYMEGRFSSWQMHHTPGEQLVDRINKVARGVGSDPFDNVPGKTPEEIAMLKNADNYAKYYTALYNTEYLEVKAEPAPNGVGKRLVFHYKKNHPPIEDFLNIHASKEGQKLFTIEDESYTFDKTQPDGSVKSITVAGQKLTLATTDIYASTVTEGKGVRRNLSIGSPMLTAGVDSTGAPYQKITAERIKPDMHENPTLPTQGVEDPQQQFWTVTKLDQFRRSHVDIFLQGIDQSGAKGQAIHAALKAKCDQLFADANMNSLIESGTYKFKVIDTNGIISIQVTPVTNSANELNLFLEKFDYTDAVSGIEQVHMNTLLDKLWLPNNIAQITDPTAKQKFLLPATKTQLKNALQIWMTANAGSVNKITKIDVRYDRTNDTFSLVPQVGSVPNVGEVKVGFSYAVDVVSPTGSVSHLDTTSWSIEYTPALRGVIDGMEGLQSELQALDQRHSKSFYKFMMDAANIDTNQLDADELNQTLGHLYKILDHSRNSAQVRALANTIRSLPDNESKAIVVNRFKQIFAYLKGLHAGKVGVAELLTGSRKTTYKTLRGLDGLPLSSAMVRIFEDADNQFIANPRSAKGNALVDNLHKDLVGYTAFYRRGGDSYTHGEHRRWSLTAPGTTQVLENFIREVPQAQEGIVRDEFVKNFSLDEFSQQFMIKQMLEQCSTPLAQKFIDVFTPDKLTAFLKNETVTLTAADGTKAVISGDVGWYTYLLGPCGNRSYGYKIKSLKITTGTTTTTTSQNLVEDRDGPYTRQEQRSMEHRHDADGPMTVVGGGWKGVAEDFSVAMQSGADVSSVSVRVGISVPVVQERKPERPTFTDDSSTTSGGQGTGNSDGSSTTSGGQGTGSGQGNSNGSTSGGSTDLPTGGGKPGGGITP